MPKHDDGPPYDVPLQDWQSRIADDPSASFKFYNAKDDTLMTGLIVDVTLAPHIQAVILKLTAGFKGLQDTAENRARIEAEVSYRLHSLTGAPPGTFVVTAVPEGK